MRLPPRRATAAVVLVAGLALGGCQALDGDLAPSASTGLGAGDVAATAWAGDVVITSDELADGLATIVGVDRAALLEAPPAQVIQSQRQLLTQLVQQQVFGHAAEEQFGVVVTDEDVDAEFDRVAGSRDSIEDFENELAQQGLTPEQFRQDLRLGLLAPLVLDELLAEAGVGEDDTVDQTALLQEWARDAMTDADPMVARRFGRWDPSSLTVTAADSTPQGVLQAGQ